MAGAAPDTGWLSYAPLTEAPYTRRPSVDYWILGLLVTSFGTIATGLNLIITVVKMRAPGMSPGRIPVFVWMSLITGFVIIWALPSLTAAQVMLLVLPFLAPFGERSPARRPWAVGAVGLSAASILVLVWYGSAAPWSPDVNPAPFPNSVTAGLDANAARGALLFRGKACIACHSIEGSGGRRGPDLTTIGGRLTADQLTWRILSGGDNMPAYGEILQPDEVSALVAFLQTRISR